MSLLMEALNKAQDENARKSLHTKEREGSESQSLVDLELTEDEFFGEKENLPSRDGDYYDYSLTEKELELLAEERDEEVLELDLEPIADSVEEESIADLKYDEHVDVAIDEGSVPHNLTHDDVSNDALPVVPSPSSDLPAKGVESEVVESRASDPDVAEPTNELNRERRVHSPMEAAQILAAATPLKKQKKESTFKYIIIALLIIALIVGAYFFYLANQLSEPVWGEVISEPVMQEEQQPPNDTIKTQSDVVKANQETNKIALVNKAVPVVENKAPVKSNISEKSISPPTKAPDKALPPATKSQKTIEISREQVENPIDKYLLAAYAAYTNGDYALAVKNYEAALTHDATNRDAILGVAAIAMQQGNYEKAKSQYTYLINLDSSDDIALAGLINLMNEVDLATAESELKFIIANGADSHYLHFVLGNVYVQNENWPDAQASFFKAFSGESTNPDYAYNLAITLDQLQEYAAAKKYYQLAVVLSNANKHGFDISQVHARIDTLSAFETKQ